MTRQTLGRGCGLATVLVVLCTPSFAGDPDGYHTYDGLEDQFTIDLPAGWSVYDQNAALGVGAGQFGMVIFSAQSVIKPGEAGADPDLMSRVDSGEIPSFFVDRGPAGKGMACAKFTKSAAGRLGAGLARNPIFGKSQQFGFALGTKGFPSEPDRVGGCQAYRYHVKARKGEWIVDIRAVSDGDVLYLFSLRNRAENYARNVETYEKAIATVRFASAAGPAPGERSTERRAGASTPPAGVAEDRDPRRLLVADLEEVPVPAGAIALPDAAAGIAAIEQGKGKLPDYPDSRVRAHIVAGGVEEIEAAMREKWPGFRFVRVDVEEIAEGARNTFFVEFLRRQDGGWVASGGSVSDDLPFEELQRGMLVGVLEFRHLPEESWADTPGVLQLPKDARGLFSFVSVIDYRVVAGAGAVP